MGSRSMWACPARVGKALMMGGNAETVFGLT
jgi:hypothetical protein